MRRVHVGMLLVLIVLFADDPRAVAQKPTLEIQTIPTPELPHSAMWNNGFLYTSNAFSNTLYRIDPDTSQVLDQHYPLIPDDPQYHLHGITSADDGTIWVVNFFSRNLYHIRDDDYTVLGVLPLPDGGFYGITFDETALWVGQHSSGNPQPIYRIDPQTGAVLNSWTAPDDDIHGLAWDGKHLWALSEATDGLYKMTPSGDVLEHYAIRPGTWGGLAFDGRFFWSADSHLGVLSRFQIIVSADFNADGHVDGDDLALFEACASGPAIPLSPECQDRDLDGDGDVDQADLARFQLCYSGPDNPADIACED